MMMNDPKKMEGMLTADAMASGGVLPQSMPAMEASKMIGGLTTAFPDLKFEVQEVMVNGNQATVKANIRGTQTGTFSVPLPGMPTVPPTGKKVSETGSGAPDAFPGPRPFSVSGFSLVG